MGARKLTRVAALGVAYGVGWLLVDVLSLLAYPYCDHPTKCFDYEEELAASVDPAVDPCDNFYEHVCGNWDRMHPVPGTSGPGQLLVLQSRVYGFVLNELERSPPKHQVKAVRRSVSAYQRCLNVFEERRDHTKVVFEIFKKFNFVWPSLTLPIKFDLMEYLLGMSLEYNLATPAQLYLVPYMKTYKRYGLGFSVSEIFQGPKVQEDIAECIPAVAPLVKRNSAIAFAERILAVHRDLSTSLGAVFSRLQKWNIYSTIKDLASEAGGPGMIAAWLKVINDHLPHDRAVGKTEQVLTSVGSGLLLKMILDNGKRSRYADIVLYAGWQILIGLRSAVSPLLVECLAANDLHAQMDSGLECLKSTHQVAQFALVRWFVDSLELQPNMNVTKSTWNAVSLATRENFAKLSWMDPSTAKGAVEHVDSMLSVVALPEHLQTNEALEAFYDYLEPDESQPFISWLIKTKLRRLEHQKRLLKVDPTVTIHRDDVEYDPFDLNAFYQSLYRTMVVQPAFIASPVVSETVPVAVNYGAIGKVLRHEPTHALDPKLGSLTAIISDPFEWWSLPSLLNFASRRRCLKRQLKDYTADTAYSENSLSEAFADTAGTEKARLAFASLPAGKGLLGYTQEQSFFIAGCFEFCGERAYAWDEDKKYPPLALRCNLPAANEKRFAAAFNCPSEAALNPRQRCAFRSIEGDQPPDNSDVVVTGNMTDYW
ncbi:endothelin-converting enzyme homolog [Dermacentor albipictus]|uniref:endothelin-converting enzyme homolog n=1 Tax=Dermacentor albipictus TaxID=60249 RepID=UPI0038FC645A